MAKLPNQDLIDSLTSHISLYHSKTHPTTQHRLSILRWFTSLTTNQRQSHLTTFSINLIQILLQMSNHILTRGTGRFILLPDLPQNNTSLPTLCYRKSNGLLSRVSNRYFNEIKCGVRLFGSEGSDLDVMSVSEELVEDVERFVGIMDGITNGAFLNGDGVVVKEEWGEMGWLKEKGYYSLEEFVVNRIEIALRLAWLGCCKRKGAGRVKERVGGAGVGVGVNFFWRNKGCVDWWEKLDGGTRERVFVAYLGKAAKMLIGDIMKCKDYTLDNEIWRFDYDHDRSLRCDLTSSGRRDVARFGGIELKVKRDATNKKVSKDPSPLNYMLSSLYILQAISAILSEARGGNYDKEKLFFSSLDSVNSLADIILRKMRELLMIVSLDCTKYELLGDGKTNSSTTKLNEKPVADKRKKKGKNRNKKSNPVPKSHNDEPAPSEPSKGGGDVLPLSNQDIGSSCQFDINVPENVVARETHLSAIAMEPAKGDSNGKLRTAPRKSRKARKKHKSFSPSNLEVASSQSRITEIPSALFSSQNGPTVTDKALGNLTRENVSNIVVAGRNRPQTDVTDYRDVVTSIGTHVDSNHSSKTNGHHSLKHHQNSTRAIRSRGENNGNDSLKREVDKSATSIESVVGCNDDMCSASDADSSRISSKRSNLGKESVVGCNDDMCSASDADSSRISSKRSNLGKESVVGCNDDMCSASDADSSRISSKRSNLGKESVVGCNDDMCSAGDADSNRIFFKRGNLGKETTSVETERNPSMQGSLGVVRVGAFNLPANVSYEWPNIAALHPSPNTHLPTATDRLHLDVGHNWQNHFHHSFVQTLQVRNSPIDNTYSGVRSRHLPMNLDCPPSVRSVNRLVPSVTCSYDSEFISRRQSSLQRGFTVQRYAASSEDERTISTDMIDFPDVTSSQELMDEHEKHWMSEDESEAHALSGMDYNQYFGNGVMYWNPSDLPGAGPSFSRPPSLCSDDSSWAWREADMSRAVDDMVAFSSSYSTNGLTSPSTASFCSPFDPLGSGPLGYVVPGSEISGKVLTEVVAEDGLTGSMSNISGDGEIKTVDSLPYPILRPIIIPNMSRERSRSDFKRGGYDHKSPCVPPNRREHPRIKRPPSPVILCVPHAPRPPPPSPAGDCRRHRGFPTVRSGSSSPRHWGVKGWLHDGVSFEEACLPADGSEVVWPSWRNKGLSRQLTQPLVGTLLQDRLIAIAQLARDKEHPDVKFPLEPPESQNTSNNASLSRVHDTLHDEIDTFCKQVAAENMIRKPYINWAVKRVARSLQVLWPRSRTNVFGSNATGLSLPSSDVDLVICLPPVRNLEPIKEAGILEGRNGIKETCLQHAARYLANQEWVKSDSLKIVENTAIPVIMLVVEVPHNLILSNVANIPTPKEDADQLASEEGDTFQTDAASSESSSSPKWSKITNDANDGVKVARLDISFKSPTHTGLQTTGLVKDLIERFPAITPLALVLKQFLADRSLDQSYSGGLNSYCLILLITRFLQHVHHHGRPTNQNYGSLLMDFLYFFGNVFDPRQMRISVQGSGLYLNRERGCSIDPLYIDDPLFLTNNVGRNCFRIHQCVKAFADAYTMLKNELPCVSSEDEADAKPTCKLLPKIIPSIGHLVGL